MWRLGVVQWLLRELVQRQWAALQRAHILDDVQLARQVLDRAAKKVS